ncbi:MAG: site-2 protease family protein [Myxococcales bacterium]|nr:site-2 protease family protein [Myxococcales bacterium]
MGFSEILTAIITISVLIIIHEFGHYICAVSTGMKVDRFSILGIGPVVARLFTYKGTEFVISAIPFGAYVHIVGMEAEDEAELARRPPSPDDKFLFRNRPLWARMLTIVGGPVANYITASLIIFSVLAVAGNRDVRSMEVDAVQAETAIAAGLTKGDELLSIAGADVTGEESYNKITATTGAHKGETVPVLVRREGAEVSLEVPISDAGLMGVGLVEGEVVHRPASLGHSAKMAVLQPFVLTQKQLKGLYYLITRKIDAKVSGPVGIVREIAKSAEKGVIELFLFAAGISTLLGLFNLLPLPALDGGRLVFLVYELIARRPANRRIEEMIHGIGMLALLGLILYVTVANDIFG